jgi:subtilisin family serine protease
MKFSKNVCLAAIAASMSLVSLSASADNIKVLIIDSGSDFSHSSLKPLAVANNQELNGNAGADDDNNGYIDDIYGWNFVENSATLVNLKDTPPDYDKVLRCMELLGKLQAYGKEGLTAEEYNYLVTNYQDKKFWAWVGFVGGWAHGTHCAGIASSKNDIVGLNAIKHIPPGNTPALDAAEGIKAVKHMMVHKRSRNDAQTADQPAKVSLADLEKYFTQLGMQWTAQVKEKASYIASLKPRLINCSYGSENSTIKEMMRENMVKSWGFQDPTDAEVQEVVNLFVTRAFLPRDKAMFAGCSDALVFIAAGNSSEDLDPFVTSPNNVPIANKIVIAATDEDQKIAPFSCYGIKTVDVAVPGVNIYATYPNNKMGYMSGTSMACPNALRYASMVLNANPALKPVQLKKILMETVDKKDWLKDKVKSGGVINVDRAIFAAKQMLDGKTLFEAIKQSKQKVSDKSYRPSKRTRPDLKDNMVKELYFSVIK